MASLTTANVLQNNYEKFGHKAMQDVMAYLGTFNMTAASLAINGTSTDIQTTTAAGAMLNGQCISLASDAAMDISADTEGTVTAWATGTSYSVGDIRSSDTPAGENVRYRCIAAHTSASTDEPGVGENTDTYWEEAPHGAVNASGTSITAAYDQWFLVTAKADGTLTVWESGDEAASGTAECKVPQYDHKMYIPIGFIHIANATSSAFVVGDTGLDTSNVTDTYIDVVGPVFPHPDNWDSN